MAAEGHSQEYKPRVFTQGQLNDLVRNLGLLKEASEILALRLDEHNSLDSQTKITFYRGRNEVLTQYFIFTKENNFLFWNNVNSSCHGSTSPQTR